MTSFDRMKKQSRTITSIEDEKYLFVKYQYKGTYTTCRRYRHKPKDCCHIEGANIPKYNYCDKTGNIKKWCHKRTKEENPRSNKNKYNKKKFNYLKTTN